MAKRIYGIFDDEEALMHAIPHLKEKGVVCKDVQSPFPIHGIEALEHHAHGFQSLHSCSV